MLFTFLFLVAKKKSLFEDRPTEIQDLTYIIKEDLNSLNQEIAKLQEVAKEQKKSQKSEKQHIHSHSSSVVLALQSKLATMSTEFKHVLDVRTEVRILCIQIYVQMLIEIYKNADLLGCIDKLDSDTK